MPENIALSTQYGNKPEIKAVWICAVINRATGRLQLWEISQSTIKDAIVATAQAVGNPCNYDIVVTRTKKSGKVSYTVTPTTPASLSAADQTLVSGYAIQPGKMFSGGKGLENISDSEAAAVPTPPDNIEALLRKALVDDEMTPERVAQLEEWALGYLTQFDAIAGAGNGGDLIASILNPYKVEAPAASVPLPVAPAAPTKALVGAGAAVDDIPF
ncbi:MAG: hypothetical protein U5M23_00295 [Marinagarivorans sp.]|nr:hypothetical protein [Marinagarivorans sp.]